MPKANAKTGQTAKTERQKPRGRTTRIEWPEELMQDICDHLTTGKSLIEIGALQGYPSSDSMYRQMAKDPDFASRIARAREAGQDHEADACVRMADMATAEDHQVVKLRIWARQWRAAKLAPKRYGERQQHDVTAQVEVHERRTLDVRLLSEDQRATLRQVLADQMAQLNAPAVIDGEFSEVEED